MAWPARTMARITPPASGFLTARVARINFDMMRGSELSFTSGQPQERLTALGVAILCQRSRVLSLG